MKKNPLLNKIRKEIPKEVRERAQLSIDRSTVSMKLFGVPYEDLGQLGKWEVDDAIKIKQT